MLFTATVVVLYIIEEEYTHRRTETFAVATATQPTTWVRLLVGSSSSPSLPNEFQLAVDNVIYNPFRNRRDNQKLTQYIYKRQPSAERLLFFLPARAIHPSNKIKKTFFLLFKLMNDGLRKKFLFFIFTLLKTRIIAGYYTSSRKWFPPLTLEITHADRLF